MNMKSFITCLLLTLCVVKLSAQESHETVYNELDDAAYRQIIKRAKQEVNQFTSLLEFMVKKPNNPSDNRAWEEMRKKRRGWRNDALLLFVGKGQPYYTYVLDENDNPIDTIKHDPVKMQVTSLRDTRPRDLELRKYLSNLIEQANKDNSIKTVIQTTKWQSMKASEIRKIDDGQYVLDVYFEQTYIRTSGELNRLLYADKTTKRVTCYIEIIETDLGTEFIVRLGDVQATDTQEIEL